MARQSRQQGRRIATPVAAGSGATGRAEGRCIVMRSCRTCRQSFIAQKSYHSQCLPCWREERDAELRRDAHADGYWTGYRAGYADAGRARPPASTLDADLLMQAIVLCHPDRHPPERHEAANRVTARLLALREAVRQW
jgi:hypothetical protein